MERLEERFNDAIERWREHCCNMAFSSRSGDYVECRAYQDIVVMGEGVLPLIRKLYDKKGNYGFACLKSHLSILVREIIGEEFQIPEEIRGRVCEIEKYTKSWLDKRLGLGADKNGK
jgi:hypothetical protein